MGSKYRTSENPFSDVLIQSMVNNIDLTEKQYYNDIFNAFIIILESILDNPEDVVYLDFEFKGDKNNVKVVANNLISALWLSGIFPYDVSSLINKSTFNTEHKIYRYNRKTKKLIIKKTSC